MLCLNNSAVGWKKRSISKWLRDCSLKIHKTLSKMNKSLKKAQHILTKTVMFLHVSAINISQTSCLWLLFNLRLRILTRRIVVLEETCSDIMEQGLYFVFPYYCNHCYVFGDLSTGNFFWVFKACVCVEDFLNLKILCDT